MTQANQHTYILRVGCNLTSAHFSSRRKFLQGIAGLSGFAISGCTSLIGFPKLEIVPEAVPINSSFARMYGPLPNERFAIPAVNLDKVPDKFYRRLVPYDTDEKVGTLIVDTRSFYLYLVQENRMAMRYGVGLGRAGFEWSGRARVGWKQIWPKWTPPVEMIERQPELEKYSAENGGMPPGIDNPLGARALYIFQGNTDTLYRIHGSPEYWTIGKAVSSGCVRMINQDVIDLYNRVPTGSNIVVIQGANS
jgi:lipoprotein-anchoring transpeptidase ErfK/SrfK